MRLRTLAFAAAGAAALGLTGVAAAPWAANRYAESEIDKTLANVRQRSTAVVSRGSVTADIGSRTVIVRDLAVDTPGDDGAKVRVGRLTVERPGKRDGRVTAARVRFEDVVLTVANEVTTLTTVEVFGYDGPAEGLVGTPGAGKAARTQADILAQVSIERGAIPSIEVRNAKLRAVRTARDIVLGRMTAGIVSRATIADVRVDVAALPSGEPASSAQIKLAARALVYDGLGLPAALRFYAGDGEGERESVIARASIADVALEAPSQLLGRFKLSFGRVEGEDLRVRALAAPTKVIEEVEAKLERGEPPTPADQRQQILVLTDAVRALAFGRIAATSVSLTAEPPGEAPWSADAGRVELAGYADGKLDRVSVTSALLSSRRGRASVSDASVSNANASGLLAYAERVGRDQALLTAAPQSEEMLKLFPRVGAVNVAGLDIETPLGRTAVGLVRSGARGDINEVPNKIALAVENFSTPVPRDSWFSPYLRDAGIDRFDLGFQIVLSLDANANRLTLDGLNYASPDIADITLAGALADVDPRLAVASGGDFVSKLSEVKLQPFALRIVDRGGVRAAITAAAKSEGASPESYGQALARDAESHLTSVLGPSAQASATALGMFLRTGGRLEASITPRMPDTTLLTLLSLIKLGPEGIAQALDMTIVTYAR